MWVKRNKVERGEGEEVKGGALLAKWEYLGVYRASRRTGRSEGSQEVRSRRKENT